MVSAGPLPRRIAPQHAVRRLPSERFLVSDAHRSPFMQWLVRHWLCTYLLMGLAFVVFGAASLNLVQVFTANIGFLTEHGVDAVREGALQQLAELVFNAYVAIAFYLLFKTCEYALVQRLAHHDSRKDS